MYGIAIKLWSSQFDSDSDCYKTDDSVVYVFGDSSAEDILYISSVVNHLTGDDSLDALFRKLAPNIKGEPISYDEPIVKLEQEEYESGEEDFKGGFYHESENSDYNYGGGKARSKKGRIKRRHSSEYSSEDDDDDFLDVKKEPRTKETRPYNRSPPPQLWRCNKCEKECQTRGAVIAHLKICNPSQIEELPASTKKKKRRRGDDDCDETSRRGYASLSCSFCARKFSFPKSLERHEFLHMTDPDNEKLKKIPTYRKKPSVPKGNYQCDRCQCKFKVYEALERHYRAHELSASAPSEGNDTEQGLKTQKLQDGNIMRCTTCDLAYTTIGMFSLHMKKYHNRALTCEECGKKFTMPNALKNHRLNYHTSFPKTCDDCGHFCTTKELFKQHLAVVHGVGVVEKNVPCEICGKMVQDKYGLKAHVKAVHSGGKGEYRCDQCGKVFKSKGSLDYHSRTHTGDFPFRCDECGNGFHRFDKMLNCKNAHAGIFKYHCTQCEYKTNENRQFERHLTVHSAEKPFSCPVCNHHSSTASNLQSHTRKVHKITLVQAEIVSKRTRFGRAMTEEDLEVSKCKLELAEKSQDTFRNRTESNNVYQYNRNRKQNVTVKSQSQTSEEPQERPPANLPYPRPHLMFPYF